MKETSKTYVVILIVVLGWITLLLALNKRVMENEEPSKFDQAYEKVQHFDSLFYEARERGEIEEMIQFNDSTKLYTGKMIKNLMEE